MKLRNIFIMLIMAIILTACSKQSQINEEATNKLYVSVKYANLEAVKESIQDGANKNRLKGSILNTQNPCELALTNSSFDIAKYLIENGADVNYGYFFGYTVFMFLAENTDIDLCNLAIEHGADINKKSWTGKTALDYALSARGREQQKEIIIERLVDLLLNHGAKVTSKTLEAALKGNTGDNYGDGRYKIVKKVLEKLVNQGDKTGLTPVLEAVILGETDVLNGLIQSSQMNNENSIAILFYTAAFGNVDTMKLLTNIGLDLHSRDAHRNTTLIVASKYENTDMVKYLLSQGVSVNNANDESETALNLAIGAGNDDIAKILIAHGAKPSEVDFSKAAELGNVNIMHLLVSSGYKPNNDSLSRTMYSAINENQVKPIKYCIELGGNINKINGGSSLLENACLRGNLEAVKFLLESGAELGSPYNTNSPLKLAAEYGNIDVVRYLIKYGADVNAVYDNGKKDVSPLSIAITKGYFDIVKLLIENGANDKTSTIAAADGYSRNILEYLIYNKFDINCQDLNGNTPLIIAVTNSNAENVAILLKYKTNDKIKNNKGLTALDLATKMNNETIIDLLKT